MTYRAFVVVLFAACQTDGTSEPIVPDCEHYLSCILATMPEAYSAALQSYGPDSPCWQTDSTAETCAQACAASVANLGASCSCTGAGCEPVDTVFSLQPGGYTPGHLIVAQDNCGLANGFLHAQYAVDQFVDDRNPVMHLLITPGIIDEFELTGRIIHMQGSLEDFTGIGDSFQSLVAAIGLTADNTFTASFELRYSDPDRSCGARFQLQFDR